MARKPRQQRAITTVNAIIEAGFIAVAERGPGATTTRQIADIAGIGVGSLYEYFNNKEAIYEAMSARLVDDTIAMIQPLVPQLVRMPIHDAVLTLLHGFRDLLMENNERYLRAARFSFNVEIEQYLSPIRQFLYEIFTQYLMANPTMTGLKNIPAFSYIFINGGIYTLIRHLGDPASPVTFDELAEGLARMISHYVNQELTLSGTSHD